MTKLFPIFTDETMEAMVSEEKDLLVWKLTADENENVKEELVLDIKLSASQYEALVKDQK